MQKTALAIFLLLVFKGLTAQEIKFEVQYSENYSVFEFARYLSEYYPPNAFKRAFEGSKYDTGEYRELVNEFNKLNYFYWYEYDQYPYGSKIGGSTYFLLGRNLIESKTLEEFKTKSFGVIPNSDLKRFYEILSALVPAYRELVYEPSRRSFEAQLDDVRKLISSTNISRYFNEIIHFHKSDWDNSIPFIMSLYPIPDQRSKGFTATAFYNQAVGGIPLGLNDYEMLLSVMFHEAFHILYDEQSVQVKTEIASWFEESESKASIYAQLLLNESITTSLANGYVYREIKGEMLEGDWYNNKYIAQMARSLYPLVEDYLSAGKPIDRAFINSYIGLLENNHSAWLNELPHLAMNRFVITDKPEDYSAIRKQFRYNNIEEYRDQLTRLTLEELKENPVSKIIVVSNDHEEKLELIKNSFEELSDWKVEPDKDFSRAQLLRDRTYLIIINRHNKGIEDLLQNIEFKN